MTSDGPPAEAYELASYALAGQYAPSKHGPRCAVYQDRAPTDRCTCSILIHAERDARVVVPVVWLLATGDAEPATGDAEPATDQSCVWCEQHHRSDYLCPQAASTLAAIVDAKRARDVPTEVHEPQDQDVEAVLLSMLVIKGGLVDVGGVRRACLVFDGLDAAGRPLPPWLYASTDRDVETIGDLAQTMATGAVRARRRERSR